MTIVRRILVLPPTTCLIVMAVLCPSTQLAADDSAPSRSARTSDVPRVRILNWEQTEELLRKEHAGKVVLVDLWTRSCPACVEGFPDFVRLQERFGRDKFACVSVNCDYDGIEGKPPEYYQAEVEKFLREQDATFDHVLLNVSLLDFLDEVKLNSTPAMFVYDPTGKLARRFDNDKAETEAEEFDVEDVAAVVEMLLTSGADPTDAGD